MKLVKKKNYLSHPDVFISVREKPNCIIFCSDVILISLMMKTKHLFHVIAGVILLFILSITLPSCIHGSKVESKKRGLMLQDKANYPTNKGKFKASKKYKSHSKSVKRR